MKRGRIRRYFATVFTGCWHCYRIEHYLALVGGCALQRERERDRELMMSESVRKSSAYEDKINFYKIYICTYVCTYKTSKNAKVECDRLYYMLIAQSFNNKI